VIYIHYAGGYNLKPGEEIGELKSALKMATGKTFRRTDRYIQLALFGVHGARQIIGPDTALFLASGEGNLSVFNRLRDQRNIDHQPPRPVDFINLLGNTAGFYIAQYFGLSGKNLFLSHHGFPAQMALILAENDLKVGREQQVLLGGVDEWLEPVVFTKKFLGICDNTVLGEGSNWLALKREKNGALASLESRVEVLDYAQVLNIVSAIDANAQIAFGMRTKPEDIACFMESVQCKRFEYESTCGYYETVLFYIIRQFIENESGELIIIDSFEENYRLSTLRVFG